MVERHNGVASRAGDMSASQIDMGLRSYMMRVYGYMGLGLALTAAIAFFVATSPALSAMMNTGLRWVFVAVWIGMGFFSNKLFFSQNQALGQIAYWIFCIVGGFLTAGLIAPFLAGFGGGVETLVRAFFITAVVFLSVSLFGYTTKRDMSGLGGFFFMAVIGIIIAGFANYFIFQSGMFGFILSCVVVLIFAAMTAYETQQIKNMYHQGMSAGHQDQAAVFGAYLLYGSFIILFWNILSILGFVSGD